MSEIKKNALGSIGFGVVLGLLILIGLSVMPPVTQRAFVAIETARFPVVGTAELHNFRDVPNGCEFAATAPKLRSCPWRQTLVYLGSRSGMNVLISSDPHKDKPTLRDVGVLEWETIFVPVGCSELGRTFADAYHQCRTEGGSMTRSKFWNKSNKDRTND